MNKSTEQARKHASIRKKNIKLIINLLRNQPNSTYGVGKTLNLSSGGAKKLVDDIADGGIIAKISGATERTVQGRPPIEYGVNPGYCQIAVVNYAAERVSLYDFSGTEIDGFGFDTNLRVSDEDVYALADRVEEMIARHRDAGPLAAISISFLGRVDAHTHGKILSGVFRDCNINIYEYYKKRFNTEMILRNDLQFAILAERQSGAITGAETSCCYMQIGNGVASAMLIGDKLYLGAHGIAGEIGQNSLICSADAGRVEDYIDCGGLKREIRAAISAGEYSVLTDGCEFSDILKAYREGDALAVRKVGKTATNAALLIKNMIEFMDFDTIILSGPMTSFGEDYIGIIRKTVRDYGYATTITVSELGDNATFVGAFEAARDEIIEKFAEARTAHIALTERAEDTIE